MGLHKEMQIDIMNDAQILLQMFQSAKNDYPHLNFGTWVKLLLQNVINEMKTGRHTRFLKIQVRRRKSRKLKK